jgi:hypothetical protein
MSKQTAVEWLEEQDNVLTMKLLEKKLTPREFVVQKSKLVEQAKQMEKEQIVDAIFFGMQKGLNVNKVPETDNDWVNNYYNETYGGQDEN